MGSILWQDSNSIDEGIASPGPLGFIRVLFEDGNESVKGNVDTPFGDLLEEGGGCIEISSKVTAEILSDEVFKADDYGKDAFDSRPFMESVPQLDITIGETDHHSKELFLGMDERDFLVLNIMKVKDVEATRHGFDATDGKHFNLGGEASGMPTEELLRNEDAMKEDIKWQSPEVRLEMAMEFMIALLTNFLQRKDLLDEDLLRPGRLECQVEISLPDENGRLQIIQIHTNKMKENSFLAPDVNLQEFGN